MPFTSEPFAVAESLRLTFCPGCDYSLEGLPPTGTCPECGTIYDQSSIVLRARPLATGGNQSAATSGTFSGNVGATAVAVVVVAVLFRAGLVTTPMGRLFAGMFLLPLVAGFSARQSSPRPGYVLLWLSPAGIAQGPLAAPGTLANGFWVAVQVFSMFGYFAWALFDNLLRSFRVSTALLVGLPLFGLTVMLMLLARRYLTRIQLPATPTRSALWPWSTLRTVSLTLLKDDGYRIIASRTDGISTTNLVNVQLKLTSEQATAFRGYLQSWTPVRMRKPSWFEKMAGGFGRLLHRLTARS